MFNLIRIVSITWSCCSAAAPALSRQISNGAHDVSPPTISVKLTGGRVFTAALDERTTSSLLWLRFERDGAVLLRPIDWDRVERAEVAGSIISGKELRGLIGQLRQAIPARTTEHSASRNIAMIGSPEPPSVKVAGGAPSTASEADRPESRRVVSLQIEAAAANWDEDVEADGLLIHVFPLDADGVVVPVHGTLQMSLKAARNGVGRQRPPFINAGRWTWQVRPSDFGPRARGAVFRLPFQSVNPEFEPSLASYGVAPASLCVPGQGTFEATAAIVRIRPFSPIRDHLWQTTGHRFFPEERTGDGRR